MQNYCFAPIHADTKTSELTYTNSFYYIGHFSKFVKPGARLITSSSTSDNLSVSAFENSNGKIAIVVMNKTDKAQPFLLAIGNGTVKHTGLAHSITTFLVNKLQLHDHENRC